jgi:predicted N-acetyltransferase YhbS
MPMRPLQRDDAGAVLDLWNRAALYDPLTADLLAEKTWGDPDFDADVAIVAVDDGEVAGFAVGVHREETGRGYLKLLAVEPARQRRGIGSALLEAVEARLATRSAPTVRLLESAPNYLSPGIDTRDEAALAFAAASGYRQVGEARNLSVDLARRPAPRVVPDGVEVRRAVPGDGAALNAFLDAHWPSWKAESGVALRNAPSTLHLALRGDRVVGFAAWDANHRGTGWFGPMGVAPDEQGAGLGCVLLQRCLDDIQRAGHDAAVIAWVDNAPFYARCAGAVPARTFIRFEKSLHED